MIKQLAKCVRQYKKESILTPLMVMGEVAFDIVMPYLMAMIIDYGIAKNDMRYILRTGGVLFICALLALLFGVLSGMFAATASTGFAKNIRQDMYHNIQSFSFANLDKFSTASLAARLTTDTTNVQISFQMIIRILVRAPLILLFSAVMAYNINKQLSLIFVFTIPVLGLGLYYIQSRAQPMFKTAFRRYDRLSRVVQENLRGIRVVKSYAREDYECQKFSAVSEIICQKFSKAEKLLALNHPLMQFIMYVCMAALFWQGGHLIVAGSLTAGKLVSLVSYMMQTLVNLLMLSMVLVMATVSRASAERIVEVLEEQNSLCNPSNPILSVKDGSIDFEHVSFGYAGSDNQQCLSNVDFSIKSGQTVGIIGGTGSSKSTLVQLIPRLYDPAGGTVKVGGVDIRDYDLDTLRNNVSMVLQKNMLFSGTIKDNLRWGNPDATREDMIRTCELAQADTFIQQFPKGYDTYIEQGGRNVSGGQKQRLCIARALLKKPKVLILDDSTSAVDAGTELKLQEAFARGFPETTKIIITHRISSVKNADQIFVMDNGRVDAVGNHASLLGSNKIYQELYRLQEKGADYE